MCMATWWASKHVTSHVASSFTPEQIFPKGNWHFLSCFTFSPNDSKWEPIKNLVKKKSKHLLSFSLDLLTEKLTTTILLSVADPTGANYFSVLQFHVYKLKLYVQEKVGVKNAFLLGKKRKKSNRAVSGTTSQITEEKKGNLLFVFPIQLVKMTMRIMKTIMTNVTSTFTTTVTNLRVPLVFLLGQFVDSRA